MIALAISVNGKQVGTIGVGLSGVVGAHVFWTGRRGEKGDGPTLSYGGLDSATDEHIRWPDPPQIKVGDTVTIKVIKTDVVDPPTERKTPAQLIEDEKAFMAKLKTSQAARLRRKKGKKKRS